MAKINKNNEDINEFIELLLQIAKDERIMDINRCLLSQDLYIDVSSLYNYILFRFSKDNNISRNIITSSTLNQFISSDLDIQINTEILSKIFDFYSKREYIDGERFLDFIEFSDIFYPRYNLTLRKYLQQRNGLNKELKALNLITRMILRKIFNKQINIIKYLIHYNDKINIDCEDLFKRVSNNKIFITKQDIINLFTHEKIFFTTEDIDAIIIALSYNNKHFYSNNSANIEEGIYYKSFENIFNIDKKIFPKKPLTNDDKISILKSIILNTIYQEKKVEEAKTLIIKREDFNFNSLLNLFVEENLDKSNDKIEFDIFIKKLNLLLDETEYELLLRRIDLLRKRYLYKSDLFEFFIPYDRVYRDNIENNEIKDKKYFSKGTMIYINNLINVVIKGEKEINKKKMELNNDNEFIENTFKEICNIPNKNKKENEYIDYFNKEQSFKYFKEKLNMEISENEANLFFMRLDKLRRGRIQILEFSDELNYITIKNYKK